MYYKYHPKSDKPSVIIIIIIKYHPRSQAGPTQIYGHTHIPLTWPPCQYTLMFVLSSI